MLAAGLHTPQAANAAAGFTQLTTGGCCVQPYFSPDGRQALFIDKPSPDAPTGLYGVPLDAPLSTPQLFSQRLGPFSADMAFTTYLEGRQTIVERLRDGKKWTIRNGGRRVIFSPDNTKIAWTVSQESGNFDVRRSEIWVANIDGTKAKRIGTRYGGGVQSWLSDSARLVISGKPTRNGKATLGVLSLANGSTTDLVEVSRLRSALLSPDGGRLVYFIGQSYDDPSQNGMWLLDVNQPGQPHMLNFFGAYRWCDATRLLYVPLKPGAPGNELWVYDTAGGQQRQLIAADGGSPFKIANGDWDVSPDGRRILFLSARDQNIWLADLGGPCGG